MKTFLRFATVCCASIPMLVCASEREYDAHEHGHVLLQIALDGNQLLMEMRSPAINIVGFEHKAETETDKDKVEWARKTLESFRTLYVLNEAGACQPQSVIVESELFSDHNHEGDEHSEFHAHYRAACENPGAITKIVVNLFSHFPGIEEIDVQIISDEGQTSIELEPDHFVLVLP